MSRPIKFRKWDKDLKRMHVCGEDMRDSIIFDDNNEAYYYNEAWYYNLDKDKAYELMQYTGLKDRNGKEIYEGDVIQMDCGCDSEYGCSHGPWHGYVKWDPETASYELRDMDGRWSGEAFEESMIDEYLVVGNIYETPLEDPP
jgi:uncharacterized phage protein (TIGR01671 family)